MIDISPFLEQSLTRQMSEYPFHNLELLTGKPSATGGTCFDQALKLRQTLNDAGINAHLHEVEVCMTGEKSHRLVRVENHGSTIFLDAGTGWPTVYTVDKSSSSQTLHEIAGIRFQVSVDSCQALIKRYDGTTWRNMSRISFSKQNEQQIMDKYKNRYIKPLPFSDELRFCWLKDGLFYRITGSQLSIYGSGKPVQSQIMSPKNLLSLIKQAAFSELTSDLEFYFTERL